MLETNAIAAFAPDKPLGPFTVTRRPPGPRDVAIEILFCGICHSDLHQARDEWGGSRYPMVPGHEIVGRVTAVGAEVTRFAVGDTVGVGCFVDSCRTCPSCARGDEQYCEDRTVFTYNSVERDGVTPTYGGYARAIVVNQDFVLRVRHGGPLDRVAPLLCAGITTWSPLRHWKVGKGIKVGVIGLGGLGHMAIQLAAALGAEVTLFSHSERKRADALRLGAHEFVLTSEEGALAKHARRLDFLLDTVSAPHDLGAYAETLRTDGTMVLVGAPESASALNAFSLILRRRAIAGSLIGGIAETQEMLDFCAERNIGAEVETIRANQVNEAYDRLANNDVKYRFVIDTTTIGR
jgi:uncharacterized zinc-type alcohol dehydrogenase-like protein